MRLHAALAVLVTLAIPVGSFAQPAPSAEQIVKSLTPTSTSGPTRGIRVAPAASPRPQSPVSAPSVSLNVNFATGSAELTPDAQRVLDNLGRALSDQTLATYRFRIEGHTDTVGTHE